MKSIINALKKEGKRPPLSFSTFHTCRCRTSGNFGTRASSSRALRELRSVTGAGSGSEGI